PTSHSLISAFAAAKKPSSKSKSKSKSKSRGSSSTAKGFGPPPPSLDDLLSSFPTRLPPPHDDDDDDDDDVPCPCRTPSSSGPVLPYRKCCRPLHAHRRECTSKTDVLRSRYSAFAFRSIEYVMRSTHPSCRDYREDEVAWAKDLNRGGMFDSFEFVGLTIVDEEEEDEDGNEGYITFRVTLRARDIDDIAPGLAAVAGRETVITERSKFLKDDNGIWKYAGGEVRSDRLEDVQLNK
ncbi:hypothetical protein ACHAXS_009730, partial [Conticribra weissflogii]